MSPNDIYNKGEEVAQKGSVESSIQDLDKENETCELSENLKIQEENEPLHGNSDQNEEKEVLGLPGRRRRGQCPEKNHCEYVF